MARLRLVSPWFQLATTTASEVNDILVALQPHLSKLLAPAPEPIAELAVQISLTKGLSTAAFAALTRATSVDTPLPAVMEAVRAAKSKQELERLKGAVVKACSTQTAAAFDWFSTSGLQPSPQPAMPTTHRAPYPPLLLGTHQLVAGDAVPSAGASTTPAPYPGVPTARAAPGVSLQPAAPAAVGQQVVRVSGLTRAPPEQVGPLLTPTLGVAVFFKPKKDAGFAVVAPHKWGELFARWLNAQLCYPMAARCRSRPSGPWVGRGRCEPGTSSMSPLRWNPQPHSRLRRGGPTQWQAS